jgi:hypothetical protein
VASGVVLALALIPASAGAQTSAGPNQGALSVAGGVDTTNVYVFRGLVQESKPKLTLFPYASLGFALKSDGSRRTLGLDVGVWNSLNTGNAGSAGFTEHLHYQENLYATLSLALSRSLTAAATFTTYTSPNLMFETVREASLRVSQSGPVAPYVMAAMELGAAGADSGTRRGTYVELGATPQVLRGRLSVTAPVRLGLSASNYYELNGIDHKYGFLSVGGHASLPLGFVQPAFGRWALQGGVDYYHLGTTAKAVNNGTAHKIVASGGVSFSY